MPTTNSVRSRATMALSSVAGTTPTGTKTEIVLLTLLLLFSCQLQRQVPQPPPRRCRKRIGDGGRDRWNAGLADAGGLLARRSDVDLDARHLVYADRRVVVKV